MRTRLLIGCISFILVLFLIAGCEKPGTPPTVSDDPSDSVKFDVRLYKGQPPLPGLFADSGAQAKVVDDTNVVWECDLPQTCTKPFERFVNKAKKYEKPIAQEQLAVLARESKSIDDNGAMPSQQLRDAIVEGLNIGYLIDDLKHHNLKVTRTKVVDSPEYFLQPFPVIEEHLVIEDPWLGQIAAVLHRPRSGPIKGVILALHGHGGSAISFLVRYKSRLFCEKGIAVLAPDFPVMGADETEDRISRMLMMKGHSLLGLQVYTALVAKKYMNAMPNVPQGAFGVMGNSGGSVIGNVLVRVEPDFRCFLTDSVSNYSNTPNSLLLDEVAYGISKYASQINDFKTAPMSVFWTDYDFYRDWAQQMAVTFFAGQLE